MILYSGLELGVVVVVVLVLLSAVLLTMSGTMCTFVSPLFVCMVAPFPCAVITIRGMWPMVRSVLECMAK